MLSTLDVWIIVVYGLASLALGLYVSRRGHKTATDYFLSGRNMPWWLAGISMVATTFAADTPLAVTELTRQSGLAGNWLWWNMLLGGMLTTFFFARLWRRAEVLTDLEFIELRYSGRIARFLRRFKAVYQGLVLNALIIGWVNLALMALLEGFFGLERTDALLYTALAMVFTTVYVAIAGLRGVMATDALQFVVAMVGSVVLAVLVVGSEQVGGLTGLVERVPEEALRLLPALNAPQEDTGSLLALSLGSFLAYAGLQWWGSWYPGAEPGGGGYVVQRMMSAKNEQHALGASLFFNLAHYAIRPWPWLLVALATFVLYPDLSGDETRLGFVYAMRDFLPNGLRAVVLVAFLSAYMSTISTQLNWGTSYLVHDLWRSLQPKMSERGAVRAGRIVTVALMLLSLAITTQLEQISDAWAFLLQCGAGVGGVLIMRWYWWRVNAWAELTATVLPFVLYGVFTWLHWLDGRAPGSFWQFPNTFILAVGLTTLGWVLVAVLGKKTDEATLRAFVKRVRPQGWWGRYGEKQANATHLGVLGLCWVLAIMAVYTALFATGEWLIGTTGLALLLTALCVASSTGLLLLSRRYRLFS